MDANLTIRNAESFCQNIKLNCNFAFPCDLSTHPETWSSPNRKSASETLELKFAVPHGKRHATPHVKITACAPYGSIYH